MSYYSHSMYLIILYQYVLFCCYKSKVWNKNKKFQFLQRRATKTFLLAKHIYCTFKFFFFHFLVARSQGAFIPFCTIIRYSYTVIMKAIDVF